PPWLVLESQGKGRTRHMALHVWVRQIVDDILPPLHAVHALSRAAVVVHMPGVPANPPRARILPPPPPPPHPPPPPPSPPTRHHYHAHSDSRFVVASCPTRSRPPTRVRTGRRAPCSTSSCPPTQICRRSSPLRLSCRFSRPSPPRAP